MNPLSLLNLFPKLSPILNMILSLYVYFFIFLIAFMIIRKIRRIGYFRTLVIYKSGTQQINDYKVKDGRIQIRPKSKLKSQIEWCPNLEPEHIIPAKRTLTSIIKPFGFKQKDLSIAIEDAPNCVTIKGRNVIAIGESIVSSLIKTWSPDEVKQFLLKALALSTVERKMFSDKQFYMFFGVLIGILFMTLMIAKRVGAL